MRAEHLPQLLVAALADEVQVQLARLRHGVPTLAIAASGMGSHEGRLRAS